MYDLGQPTTTLILNDAQNKLISIGVAAFWDCKNLMGTLNLRNTIDIASNAFEYTNVIVNRK